MKNTFLLLFTMLLFSCENDSGSVDSDPGYAFYPFEVGTYRIYEVEDIEYSAFEKDSAHYYLREEMVDSLVSPNGSVKYLLYRYKSPDTINWILDSVWAAQRISEVVLVYENDVPFCKIAFPVRAGLSWDGNAYNGSSAVGYYYDVVDAYSVAGQSYQSENVIRVILEDVPKNLVNQDERSEVYVRGIGLVEKDYISVDFCQVGSGCSDGDQIEQGHILRQVLKTYGKN